jgi:hypothetical protein
MAAQAANIIETTNRWPVFDGTLVLLAALAHNALRELGTSWLTIHAGGMHVHVLSG